MNRCSIQAVHFRALGCRLVLLVIACFLRWSVPAVAAPAIRVAGERKALLIALQENDPGMRGFFAQLEFPTLDVVKFYQVLKDPKVGHFQQVRVLASRHQLMVVAEKARKMKATGTPAEQEEARATLSTVDDILHDPDTPRLTLLDTTASPGVLLPTAKDVDSAMGDFISQLHEEDEAFVYLSGHGFRTRPSRGPIGNAEDVVLVAADTIVDRDSLVRPYTNGVEIESLLDRLGRSACRRVVVLQATCASKFKTAAERLYEEKYGPKGQTGAEAEEMSGDDDPGSVTLIGAAREFAYEARSASEGIRGDLFSYFFRLAMAGRLGEKVPEWRGVNIDFDHDGAISVLEAYDVAEVAVRRITAPQRTPARAIEGRGSYSGTATAATAATEDAVTFRQQQPYILRAYRQRKPFIMAGFPNCTHCTSTVFPPWHRRRLAGETLPKKGVDDGFSLWIEEKDGPKEVTEPMSLEPGRHCLQLHEAAVPVDGATQRGSDAASAAKSTDRVLDRRCIVVGTDDEVRWDIFREPSWSFEARAGAGEWFGSPAYPGKGVGDGLSSQALIDLTITRTMYRRADHRGSLEAGGRIQLGIEPGPLPSAPSTANYTIEPGLIARYRKSLYGRWPVDLLLGTQGSVLYLNNYEYRNPTFALGWGPQLGLQWTMRRHQLLTLDLDLTGVYADLDCNPSIQDWPRDDLPDPTKSTVQGLYDLLATRCVQQPDGRYGRAPGLYVLTALRLGWAWRF